MEDITLTKDADILICLIYKEYKQRRKDGKSRGNAKNFIDDHNVHEELAPKWLVEDVVDVCMELSRNGMLDCDYADNHAYRLSLSDSGIAYMEKRFKRGLVEVIEYLSKLRDIIPF